MIKQVRSLEYVMGDNRLIYISLIFSRWRQRDKIETVMTEFNVVNKMLFRVMKPIMSTKSKQAMTNTFCRRNWNVHDANMLDKIEFC